MASSSWRPGSYATGNLQLAQNLAPGWRDAPHSVQNPMAFSFSPHPGQNLAWVARGAPHFGQLGTIVSRQLPSASCLSSADIFA
jgi:hypothetical protein